MAFMRDAVPHLLPLALYLTVAALRDSLPESLVPASYVVQVVVAAVPLALFAWRGCYPELGRPAWQLRGWLPAAALGIAIGLAWPFLSSITEPLVGSREGFDETAFGAAWTPWILSSRVVGMVVLVPFAEELLVRSALPRLVDHPDKPLAEAPVGSFTWVSAGLSLAFFVLTHPEWLAALVTGVIWTFWLWRSRRLTDLVVSHAAANAALVTWILATGDRGLW